MQHAPSDGLSASFKRTHERAETSLKDTGDTPAAVLLDGFEDGLAKSWLMLEPGKQFAAFRKLPSEHKEALFAFCTARVLKALLFAGLTGSSIARNPVRR